MTGQGVTENTSKQQQHSQHIRAWDQLRDPQGPFDAPVRQGMSNSARKSCTRCKHVNCTCRGSGGGDSNDGDNLDDTAEAGQALSSSPTISEAGGGAAQAGRASGAPSGDMSNPSPTKGDKDKKSGGDKDKASEKDGHKEARREHKLAIYDMQKQDWREVQLLDQNKDGSMWYVHWVDFNRRNDQWIEASRIDWETTKERLREVRERKRKYDEFTHESHEDHEGLGEADLREHEELTKVKNVNKIQFGKYVLDTWYFSPLPREIWKAGDDVIQHLYMCEYTLNFYKTKSEIERHYKRNTVRHPPGDEIYRNGNISVFEVDGEKAKVWCQNLCYLAKMFLDHKYLYYDVDPFFFYVVCECDSQGFHVVGYFSKEKESANNYNLACILTLPQHQRKGYGKFIIAFSYALSKIEQKPGSPEKPLSDLGRVSYESYWARTLLVKLREVSNRPNPEDRMISIQDLADETCFTTADIESTLKRLQILQYSQGAYFINANPKLVEYWLGKCGGEGVTVDQSKICWTPHVSTDRWLR